MKEKKTHGSWARSHATRDFSQPANRLLRWFGYLNYVVALAVYGAACLSVFAIVACLKSTHPGWGAGYAAGAAFFIFLPSVVIFGITATFWIFAAHWQKTESHRGLRVARGQTILALLPAGFFALETLLGNALDYQILMMSCFTITFSYCLFGALVSWQIFREKMAMTISAAACIWVVFLVSVMIMLFVA